MEDYLVSCFKVWDQNELSLQNIIQLHQSTPLYTKNLELELKNNLLNKNVFI